MSGHFWYKVRSVPYPVKICKRLINLEVRWELPNYQHYKPSIRGAWAESPSIKAKEMTNSAIYNQSWTIVYKKKHYQKKAKQHQVKMILSNN